MAKKENRVNLDKLIIDNIDSFKQGDFSMLTDEETEAFLAFINYFVYKQAYNFKSYELEDVTYEVFLRVMESKLYELDVNHTAKPTTYLGEIIKSKINHIIIGRETLKRKANNDKNKQSLDDKIYNKKEKSEITVLDKLESSYSTPLENILIEEQSEYNEYIKSFIKKDEILALYLLENKTYQEIGTYLKMTREAVRQRINKSLDYLKINLAELGHFAKVEVDIDEKFEYAYTLQRIKKYGITSVHLIDEVPLEKLAKFLNVEEKHINSKIGEDKSIVENKLHECGILKKESNTKLRKYVFIDIFDEYVKNFNAVPKEYLDYAFWLLEQNENLKYCYLYPYGEKYVKNHWKKMGIDKKDIKAFVEDELYEVKQKVKEFIKNNPKEVNTQRQIGHKKLKGKQTSDLTLVKRNLYDVKVKYSPEKFELVLQEISKDPILNDVYLNGMYLVDAVEKHNLKSFSSQQLEDSKQKVLISLADKGIFPNINFSENEKQYYEEIKKEIANKGIFLAHKLNNISVEDIAKVIDVKSTYIYSKISKENKLISDLLKEYKFITRTYSTSSVIRDAFIKIFEKMQMVLIKYLMSNLNLYLT